MSKYIDAEKLIAEIERFSAIEYGGNTLGDDVANGALYFVIEEIIPSLQQEQPEVDLEKEIEACFKGWYMDETDQGYILHTPDDHAGLMSVKQIARHFYELGLKSK